jgi:hypothetical protein
VHVPVLDSQEGRVVLGASLGCVKGFRSVSRQPRSSAPSELNGFESRVSKFDVVLLDVFPEYINVLSHFRSAF